MNKYIQELVESLFDDDLVNNRDSFDDSIQNEIDRRTIDMNEVVYCIMNNESYQNIDNDILKKYLNKHNNLYKITKEKSIKYKCKNINKFLQKLVRKSISYFNDKTISLNWIDVSEVVDMSYIFTWIKFNGDISQWNVSNVKNMSWMFYKSNFNSDISNWNVSKVKDMSCMFRDSRFNGDISEWDVSNVESMVNMFGNSQFNGDISEWDVSNVTDMSRMFGNSYFNGDISKWDVSNVVRMTGMFIDSKFNGDISKWDVNNVYNMWRMFDNSKLKILGRIPSWYKE